MSAPRSFTIIGGGASGTLLAVNLIRQAGEQPISIHLVERDGPPGRGVAYSTQSDVHRLNVPAGKMGAFPDAVDHFHKWLQDNKHSYSSDDFAPRLLYAQYLHALLQETVNAAPPNVKFDFVQDEGVDIDLDETQATVYLQSGRSIPSDAVILAFGNFLPPLPSFVEDSASVAPGYFGNPWDASIFERIQPTQRVLVMGMGLTAVDTLLSLHAAKHQGPLYAISTHGWWPAVHELGHSYADFSAELRDKRSVADMLHIVHTHIRSAEAQGGNWRAVIDSLRPATQALWQQLLAKEKLRFMRHLRRLWDVSRHRMPQECAAVLESLQASGQLQVLRGRIRRVAATDGSIEVSYAAGGEHKTLEVDAVINCIGSESNFAQVDLPLVQNLLSKGVVRPDALRLGLDAPADGQLSERLFTLGTALKGILWESTAMPEIRSQAHQLAVRLLQKA